MPEAEAALLRRIYAEWGRGDYTTGDFLDPDFELVFAKGFLDEGTFHGPQAAWKGWKGWLDQWSSWTYEPVKWFELGGGRIGVYIDIQGVSRTTGMELSFNSANLWEIEDGRARRLVIYAHREDMLRDLGIDAP